MLYSPARAPCLDVSSLTSSFPARSGEAGGEGVSGLRGRSPCPRQQKPGLAEALPSSVSSELIPEPFSSDRTSLRGRLLYHLGVLHLQPLFVRSLHKNAERPVTLSFRPRIHLWTGRDLKPTPVWGPTPHLAVLGFPTHRPGHLQPSLA